jgi:hypothetical protein
MSDPWGMTGAYGALDPTGAYRALDPTGALNPGVPIDP